MLHIFMTQDGQATEYKAGQSISYNSVHLENIAHIKQPFVGTEKGQLAGRPNTHTTVQKFGITETCPRL